MIVFRVACAHLAIPIKRESDVVQLLAIACYIGNGSNLWVLTSLDGILFRRQSIGIVAHRIEHVVALKSFEACIDIRCDISKWMTHMKTSTRWIGEHVEYVELLFLLILSNVIGLVLHPLRLPFLLDFSEIVFHCIYFVIIFSFMQSYDFYFIMMCNKAEKSKN